MWCNRKTNPIFFKRGLIIGQVFIGSLFFITSLVLFQQLHLILTKDKGLNYENVIQVDMGTENAYSQDIKVLMPELQNHPYITDVCYTATNANLFTEQGDWYGTYVDHFVFDPTDPDPKREDRVMIVSKEFFSFLQTDIKAG